MIITCPHCQTRYQVTYEAIGATGRKVQCATCSQAWQQVPIEPRDAAGLMDEDLFRDEPAGPEIEAELDAALAAEERSVVAAQRRPAASPAELAATASGVADQTGALAEADDAAATDGMQAAGQARRQRDFVRRRKLLDRDQPFERLRRTVRTIVGLALVGLVLVAVFGRGAIVSQFPALAGLYEMVGAGVNVVGLDFRDVTSTSSTREDRQFISVKADIFGIAGRPVPVPPVVVTLLDEAGGALYQWSVNPPSQTLMAGESVTIETQLASPPAAAKAVRLSFAGGQAPIAAPGQSLVGAD